MRINDMKYGFFSYQNQQTRPTITSDIKKTSAPAEVSISSRGREISQAMKSEQAQRHQRVQQLKQQVSEGNYHIDSQKIADKMIGFWDKHSM